MPEVLACLLACVVAGLLACTVAVAATEAREHNGGEDMCCWDDAEASAVGELDVLH